MAISQLVVGVASAVSDVNNLLFYHPFEPYHHLDSHDFLPELQKPSVNGRLKC